MKYNTNLAAEYHVLSMLYRKEFNAYLTLGNKKAVDIILETKRGGLITVDVKGLAGTTNWPLDNFRRAHKNHFIVLVSFRDRIRDHEIMPECWIVPSTKIRPLLYKNPKGNRQVLPRHTLIKEAPQYLNNWKLLKNH